MRRPCIFCKCDKMTYHWVIDDIWICLPCYNVMFNDLAEIERNYFRYNEEE